MGPLVHQAVLRNVPPCHHARHAVLVVKHDEVSQAHGAKEPVASLDGRRLVEGVRGRVHVRAHVNPQVHVLFVHLDVLDVGVERVVALDGVVEDGGGARELHGAVS